MPEGSHLVSAALQPVIGRPLRGRLLGPGRAVGIAADSLALCVYDDAPIGVNVRGATAAFCRLASNHGPTLTHVRGRWRRVNFPGRGLLGAVLKAGLRLLLLGLLLSIVVIATTPTLVASVGQNMSLDVPIVSARRPAQTMPAITKLATMARTCLLPNSTAPHSESRWRSR